jgi:hypothetical protein
MAVLEHVERGREAGDARADDHDLHGGPPLEYRFVSERPLSGLPCGRS